MKWIGKTEKTRGPKMGTTKQGVQNRDVNKSQIPKMSSGPRGKPKNKQEQRDLLTEKVIAKR